MLKNESSYWLQKESILENETFFDYLSGKEVLCYHLSAEQTEP